MPSQHHSVTVPFAVGERLHVARDGRLLLDVILLREGDGVRAFLDNCPDEHKPLRPILNSRGEIVCTEHGASFDCNGCLARPGGARHPERCTAGLVPVPVERADADAVTLVLTPEVSKQAERVKQLRQRRRHLRGWLGRLRAWLGRRRGQATAAAPPAPSRLAGPLAGLVGPAEVSDVPPPLSHKARGAKGGFCNVGSLTTVFEEPTMTTTSLSGLLLRHAERIPDAEFLYVLGPRPRCFTYAEAAAVVAGLARRLLERGVKPGDRVVFLVNLDERLVLGLLAAASVGAVGLPITVDVPACRDVLRQYTALHRPRLWCASGRFLHLLRPDAEVLPLDELGAPSLLQEQWDEWRNLVGQRSPEMPFYVNHTSGSTSRPKIVEASDRQLLANATACLERFGPITPVGPPVREDRAEELRLLCTFSYHQHEHFVRPLLAGGCAVLLPRHPVGADLVQACRDGRVTHLMTNPNLAPRLLDGRRSALRSLQGSLQVIEIGGGHVPSALVVELGAATGARVHVDYGSTETGGVALTSDPGNDTLLKPLLGYVAQVLDPDGREVGPGRTGELVLAGPGLANGYVVPPPGEVRLDGGRFWTRDLARRHEGGVEVLGRLDATVKMLGSRQPLEPVEAALREGLGGAASAVCCLDVESRGWPAHLLGSALLGVVVTPHRGLLADRAAQRRLVKRALRVARLAALLTAPRWFLFLPLEEAELSGGKLRRQPLRERLPFLQADWSNIDRARLVATPLLPGDIARAVWRLVREVRALKHPLRLGWRLFWRGLRQVFRRAEGRQL
jgi:acyl-coenzyme A synthetase/AMP-(fatty) acid ligase/nitrite reductase/ring-hydroxylating ferredoxin subunit